MIGDLYVTDGTTRINLLTGIDGFYLDDWNPSVPPAKDTWRDSPLSDGRKLAMSKWANAIETFRFKVARFTQDDVIYDTQELRRLLEAAKQYFIGGSDVPVWLEARGNCETNTRYAVVCNYSTGSDTNPYQLPFDMDHPVMTPWTLVVERQHWRDKVPDITCIETGSFVPTESADDCQVDFAGAGAITLNGTHLLIGEGAAAQMYGSGIRFRSVTIPSGARIEKAYIEFEADAAGANDSCNIHITGERSSTPAIFTTYANYAARQRTTEYAEWNIIPHWLAGTHYKSPDISRILQEIINYSTWNQGNNIVFFVENGASTPNAVRDYVAWDHAAVRYEPHLIVEWRVDECPCVQLSATQDRYNNIVYANFVPRQSEDDATANRTDATIALAGVNLEFGNDGTPHSLGSGIIFKGITVPVGATIVSSYIEFEADAADVGDSCNVVISGDNTNPHPAIFSTYADYLSRVPAFGIPNIVLWNNIPHWVGGTHYFTPDLSAIIQEIIELPGYAVGHDLSIFLQDNLSTVTGARRRPVAWDHAGADHEPKLHIFWSPLVALPIVAADPFGRSSTCLNEVYVANKHNTAQLTHIFYEDVGVGFSANLVGGHAPVPPPVLPFIPFSFLPAIPAATDAVYFGIETLDKNNSGPFCSLVFDILAAQNDLTITWEYYSGGWNSLTVRDNTNADGSETGQPFDTEGVNSVHWKQPAPWVPFDALGLGIIAYWVRAVVGAVGANPTPPNQQNRDVYTIVVPYVDTTAEQITGDIPALAELLCEGQSGKAYNISAQTILMAGLRSYNRGSNFTSFLNFSDSQNKAGITVTVNPAAGVTMVDDSTSPTGRAVDWTTAGVLAETFLAYITIPQTLVDQFTGTFRCFLRMVVNSATPNQLLLRYKTCMGLYTNTMHQTGQKIPYGNSGNVMEVLDFGTITLPPHKYDTADTYSGIYLRIDGRALAAIHVHLYDIAIVPADECFIESMANYEIDDLAPVVVNVASRLGFYTLPNAIHDEWRRLDINSMIPRRMAKTDLQDITGYTITPWSNHITGPLIWQPNEHQRWWFLQGDRNPNMGFGIWNTISLQGFGVSRYLSMRGKR